MATVKAFPEGKTLLDTFKRSFADVPLDEERSNLISTTEFLEATESMTALFDVLGSVAFQPVKKDILGNVKKIRDRQLNAPASSLSLQELVRSELSSKKHTATEGLVWLTRGLDFTAIALAQNIACPNEELSTSFRCAYTKTLKSHHSFLVKPIFSAAMSACPYRKDFFAKLGDDEILVSQALKVWSGDLQRLLEILKTFLDKEAKW
ncbi:Pleckstrin homology domain-containing family A member 8 [Golovinomyces cichoracearum]|uniref:Pleckstrin homology domain-containing family A member 8 n=1 Tax=Golovinomyces cichoracearum TaxID=62708 RepID=A0A420I525_9PEZI|nr:Pleckstrin homology domain-containing family A member 8 [Golovinomyces cichoracearum]